MDANTVASGTSGVVNLVHHPLSLISGIILIIIAIIIIFFFGQFLINSIVGLIGFFICALIGIKLPFIVTLIVTGIFGLAGLGVMLILKFFGIF
ncbi:MAG: hypothetical protein V1824_02180 [archaeon]